MDQRVISAATRPVMIDRVVYTTITLMCVLIIYDGWSQLRLIDAVLIIVGPVLAMFIAHIFSASLGKRAELRRGATWEERGEIIRFESRFLLLAVPPIALLIVSDLAGVSLGAAVEVIIILEGLSIGFWAGLAARRSGVGGWTVVLAVFVGLIVGAIVLTLQVFLQPGSAIDDGVAAGGLLGNS